jgi:hypothetical protein
MNTVECPKCTLRFEPDEVLPAGRSEIFCPQCGNEFGDEREADEEQRMLSASV